MSLLLLLHKISMLITIVIGITFAFKKNKIFRYIHYLSGLVTVISIFLYLVEIHFSRIGYLLYGFFIVFVFLSPKIIRTRRVIFSHISLFVGAICWLMYIHIV